MVDYATIVWNIRWYYSTNLAGYTGWPLLKGTLRSS
jgi:hypothetical protein